ncbi:DNA replication and repair protein RecN [Saccharicrinis carchari]|uniref:DNA repair protein RecN n=1 Tax=Saccharicrinis carchari TaxID=1168039 RepID=A0A521B2H8_SACCC|nr:DNA repair protein RecN [Saccharicrinis carchari]SMO40980.1 DNA replication and repair protein RecN [Saccharicrinis carchari]
MLKSLYVSNYALIDQVEIDFSTGFSVMTGETGAGKSIILGALSLVLGQRSDMSVLKNKDKKSVIEACFNITGYGFKSLFDREDVDYAEETTIRREILSTGKSRAFVNDTPVNLGFLKSISLKLIDIHSQHQNLLLGESGFQLNVVDTVANNAALRDKYLLDYKAYKALVQKKNQLADKNAKLAQEADYMQFQYNELESLKLVNGEQEELEQEREMLAHAEEIKGHLFAGFQLLNGEEAPLLAALKDVTRNIEKIAAFIPQGEEWRSRSESAFIDLDELAKELEDKMEQVDHDPERLDLVSSRLDQIYALQQKHRVDNLQALIEIRDSLAQQLSQISSFEEDLKQLNKDIEAAIKVLQISGKAVSQSRKKVIPAIEKQIVSQLAELGMPNARLVVECSSLKEFTENGHDHIDFQFSANKKGELSAIPKVASGGEMSRVMLCIKALLSESKGLPTIIFDEIDTGVSGEVADKMGDIMQQIAQNIQVISITHLPQIAVKGKHHYKVYKTDSRSDTQTSIQKLDYESRITEIAKMLSGSNLTAAALINAKELLGEEV